MEACPAHATGPLQTILATPVWGIETACPCHTNSLLHNTVLTKQERACLTRFCRNSKSIQKRVLTKIGARHENMHSTWNRHMAPALQRSVTQPQRPVTPPQETCRNAGRKFQDASQILRPMKTFSLEDVNSKRNWPKLIYY